MEYKVYTVVELGGEVYKAGDVVEVCVGKEKREAKYFPTYFTGRIRELDDHSKCFVLDCSINFESKLIPIDFSAIQSIKHYKPSTDTVEPGRTYYMGS